MGKLHYEKYVRKPFLVDVTQVTAENIAEIAEIVGELKDQDGRPYIRVNNNVVPGVTRAFIGYYMTRMGDNIRLYQPRVFKSQFCPSTPEIKDWVDYIKGVISQQQQAERQRGVKDPSPDGNHTPEEVPSG